MVYRFSDQAGLAVLVAWLVLIVSGRWRPEHSWLDDAGRALGWACLALSAFTLTWSYVQL
jgi:hypothetical protein